MPAAGESMGANDDPHKTGFLQLRVALCGHHAACRRAYDDVKAARVAGANMIITKPLSPKGLYDRLVWVAFDTRAFVESKTLRNRTGASRSRSSRTVRAAARATCWSRAGPTAAPACRRTRSTRCCRCP